ncbi:hypothetical protein OKJ48_33400 [Streptomyces kunmingensis]|uniref:SnoaL-like domain-containing protein n=1 Tax=Streptomyces kunmingensis TaxID=68225 RepID=A0ABU6CK70_9ACTN|nr:nuclear transport factor 2 family protein [Streptomyces kunmingensis]MEB3965088.1 hypothetical protein [Streptomyces kunmingensis]
MREHPHVELLRKLYADLTKIGDYAADDIIYHVAERDLQADVSILHGKKKVTEREHLLAKATSGTLVADIDWIGANEHFGTVMGVFRAKAPDAAESNFAMPFCGLWRFGVDGRITHHWQNAYDPEALIRFMAGADQLVDYGGE